MEELNIKNMEEHSEYLKNWKKRNSVKVENIEERLDNDEMRRAGGECVCEMCGKTYLQHPVIEGYEWLNILCNKKIVKL